MFLTAPVSLVSPKTAWCRSFLYVLTYMESWEAELYAAECNDIADAMLNAICSLMTCPPNIRIYNSEHGEIDSPKFGLAFYDPNTQLAVLSTYLAAGDDAEKFDSLFTLPKGMAPPCDRSVFIVLTCDDTTFYVRGTAVMPIGEHVLPKEGGRMPTAYRRELLEAVASQAM